jgi:biotin synthase
VVEDFLDTEEDAIAAGIEVRVWDPATQLRYAKKGKVPERPDGAPNRWPEEQPAEPAQLSGMPHGL